MSAGAGSAAGQPLVGVLALQGDFREHARLLGGLGAEVREVRQAADLEGLQGLVLPGGESTTIARLLETSGLASGLMRFHRPILGTCAGMILLDRDHLGLVDVVCERNAYGRQLQSFEADLTLDGLPLRGVFIRAPRVVQTGPQVEVLARGPNGEPVLLREGRFLIASFHPELVGDPRVHRLFLEMVAESADAGASTSAMLHT